MVDPDGRIEHIQRGMAPYRGRAPAY